MMDRAYLATSAILNGQFLLVRGEGPAARGFHVGPSLLSVRLLQKRREGAAKEKVVEDVVVGHGGYALSSVPAMNTSRSP